MMTAGLLLQKLLDDDIFVVMDSNGDYNEAIKVAENLSVE